LFTFFNTDFLLIPPKLPPKKQSIRIFYHGNVIPFARGGIFNRPTIFPMARGMGIMGEAGPEAVMPLTRGRDGKLGVKASGGQMINFNPSITINGVNKSPEQLAREIVRPLRDEMRRLAAIGG
jgi:phage-related minor tail protein